LIFIQKDSYIIMQVAPLLFGIFIGVALSLGVVMVYRLWRSHVRSRAQNGEPVIEMRDDVLIGFLVLASFALGVFLTYALLSIHL
jgi:hypothetical protein